MRIKALSLCYGDGSLQVIGCPGAGAAHVANESRWNEPFRPIQLNHPLKGVNVEASVRSLGWDAHEVFLTNAGNPDRTVD